MSKPAKMLKIGAKTFSIADLSWGLQEVAKRGTKTNAAIAAGQKMIEADFKPHLANKFCELVCTWGRGQRVFAHLERHHGTNLGKVVSQALKAAHSASDAESAIAPLSCIKGLGVSFASKHLRLMLPEQYGVLDSRYRDTLGFALNNRGYVFFMEQLRLFAESARRANRSDFGSIPISKIEHALFYLIQPKSVAARNSEGS